MLRSTISGLRLVFSLNAAPPRVKVRCSSDTNLPLTNLTKLLRTFALPYRLNHAYFFRFYSANRIKIEKIHYCFIHVISLNENNEFVGNLQVRTQTVDVDVCWQYVNR